MEAALILLLAFGLDLWRGEPRRFHPVLWMGAFIRRWPRPTTPTLALTSGLLLVLAGVLLFGAMGLAGSWIASWLPLWLGIPFSAMLLKPMFSVKALLEAGHSVMRPLLAGNVEDARHELATHLVSRDTSTLDENAIAGATISSISENFTDSIVGPLLAFALFGLPGAWAYRFLNTADAMVGYRTRSLEYFGKPAARLDDVANWIPARLAALFLHVAGWLRIGFIPPTLILRERSKTPSPNGGWTMGSAAVLLGVRLEKPGVYCLNPRGRLPGAADIQSAIRLTSMATAGFTVVLGLTIYGVSLFHF